MKSSGIILGICAVLLMGAMEPIEAGEAAMACPLSSHARSKIVNSVSDFFYEGVYVAEATRIAPDPDPFQSVIHTAFASVLPEIGGIVGELNLVKACTSAIDYDAYCEDAYIPNLNLNFCIRSGCEAKGIYTTLVYWTTPPLTSPDQRASLEYSVAHPDRTVTYDPNPHVLWRIDSTVPGFEFVTGTIQNHVKLSVAGEKPLRLSHSGVISIIKDNKNTHISSLALHSTFPALVRSQDAVVVDIRADESQGSGSINMGNRKLATIEIHPENIPDLLTIVWNDACAGAQNSPQFVPAPRLRRLSAHTNMIVTEGLQ